MGKLLVSIYAAKADLMINSKVPSDLIPFKGKFPLLLSVLRGYWVEICDNTMYVEDCPQWVQDIILKGARMTDIHDGFVYYLKQNNISIEAFKKKNKRDKATEIKRFLDANSLTPDSLKIN